MRPVPVPRSRSARDRSLANRLAHRRLDGLLGHVQRAQPVPLRRQAREEGLRGLGARLADGAQPSLVGGKPCVFAVEVDDEALHGRPDGAALGQMEEGPGPLPVAFDEPCLGKQLQVPRNTRLRLAKNVGEVRDVEFALGKQRKDSQPRLLPGRPERRQKRLAPQDRRGS